MTTVPTIEVNPNITINTGNRSWMDLVNTQASLAGQYLQLTSTGVNAALPQLDYSQLTNSSGNNVGNYLQITPGGIAPAPAPVSFAFLNILGDEQILNQGDYYTFRYNETVPASGDVLTGGGSGFWVENNIIQILTTGYYSINVKRSNGALVSFLNSQLNQINFHDGKCVFLTARDTIWFSYESDDHLPCQLNFTIQLVSPSS